MRHVDKTVDAALDSLSDPDPGLLEVFLDTVTCGAGHSTGTFSRILTVISSRVILIIIFVFILV